MHRIGFIQGKDLLGNKDGGLMGSILGRVANFLGDGSPSPQKGI